MNHDKNLMWRDHLPRGWHPLFERLVTDLLNLDGEIEIAQAKQKFGELRTYLRHYPPGTTELIDAAVSESKSTCEICGESGGLRSDNGYFQTLCDKHADNSIPAKKSPIIASFRVTNRGVTKINR